MLPRYLMNGLNSFDKTDSEYSLASTDDLIRFWRSKVKVTAGIKGHIFWALYLMNCLDETCWEAPTDDLRSKVNVTPWFRYVLVKPSKVRHFVETAVKSFWTLFCVCNKVQETGRNQQRAEWYWRQIGTRQTRLVWPNWVLLGHCGLIESWFVCSIARDVCIQCSDSVESHEGRQDQSVIGRVACNF